MSPARSFATRAPLILGPLPDIDDLEVLELDEDNADSEARVVFDEGVAVFNMDEDAADPQGAADDLEAPLSCWITTQSSAELAVTHFAIGTPGTSPRSSGAASLAGSGCATPVSSDRSRAASLQHGSLLQGETPLPGELLQAVLQHYDHSGFSEDLVDKFEIDSASASEGGSDDDL